MHSRLSPRPSLQSNCRQPGLPLPLCFDAAVPRRRPSFEDPLLKQPRRQPERTWKTSFNARQESSRGGGHEVFATAALARSRTHTKRKIFARKKSSSVVRAPSLALSPSLSLSLFPFSTLDCAPERACVWLSG